jgi:Right handed beta helix region
MNNMPHFCMWVFSLFACLSVVDELNAATYYVACDTGNDAGEGVSESTAWKSASKVSRFNFMDGDRVLFKRGCTWEDVSLKLTRSMEFAAYGEGAPPQLLGATRTNLWSRLGSQNVFFTMAEIEPSSPVGKEILVVHDKKHRQFYKKVSTIGSLDESGKFYYDLPAKMLYVFPHEDTDLQHDVLIGSKPHIFEFQQVNVERVVVDGLQISFANEYAIGFWYQSSGTKNGSLKIANCTFIGNAYQAIHIGGTNTFSDVDILNNTITANGNEGIYIGYVKGKEIGEVVTRQLRISGNTIGGQGFGWRSEGPDSAAGGEGIDIKKGIASAIIDHNTVFDLTASYGIGAQSSNVIIEHNTIGNVQMWGTNQESSVAGIFLDAYDNKGTTVVRGNTITTPGAHGIVIRGAGDLRPRFEIYDNVMTVEEPYFPFAFTGQNISNTVIRNNRTRGGRAALAILKPCCPPFNVEFHDNNIRDVSVPIVTVQILSAGLRVYANSFCFKGAVDAGQISAVPNNTFSGNCPPPIQVTPPGNLLVK